MLKHELLPLLGVPTDPADVLEQPPSDTFGWATVTSTDPLRIRKDGPGGELDMTPEVIGSGAFGAGSRVWCQLHGRRVLILGATGAADNVVRRTTMASGGGRRDVTSTGVSWSKRIITMGAGNNATIPDGFWDIEAPPNSTVIPVYGKTGGTTVTVTGGIVPLGGWDTLYYDLPLSEDRTSDPSRFVIVGYNQPFTVPGSWMPIVTRNNDYESTPYRWWDGHEQDYWRGLPYATGWSNYGGIWEIGQYKREDGDVKFQGVAAGGSGTIANLPAGYRPGGTHLFVCRARTGYAHVAVNAAGQVLLEALRDGASTASISFSQVGFQAVQ